MIGAATLVQARHLPFTVIGGYLGAGKTRLLNHLLSNAAGLRVVALVNDFGSVNIDVDLIRSHDGETMSLANSCLCCSLVNGFAQAIGQICDRADAFDHIVIEASGVADPAKIAQYGQMYRLPLDGILVVVDAEQVRTQAVNKYVGDTVLRQLAQADLIVLNKTDLVSPEALSSLRACLAQQSPGTPLIETVHSKVALEVLLGMGGLSTPASPELIDAHHSHHGHAHETFTLEHSHPLSRAAIERFATALGEDIYRAKGFVYLRDDRERRYVYQKVGTRWSLEPGTPWGKEARRTVVVMIALAGTSGAKAFDACSGLSLAAKSASLTPGCLSEQRLTLVPRPRPKLL
jgi:G3E family GTPase